MLFCSVHCFWEDIRVRLTQALLITLPLILAGGAAWAELPAPDWQALVFEKRSFWGIARAEVGIRAGAQCDDEGWRLIVDSSLPGMRETVDLTMSCEAGNLRQRNRVSQGGEQRLKIWRYDGHAITRDRHEPPSDPELADRSPRDWPLSSRLSITLPDAAKNGTVISPSALFALLGDLVDQPGRGDLIVNTDLNFYRLEISRRDQELDLGEELAWGDQRLRGRRSVYRLRLHAEPLPGNPEDDDFSFMGLSGDIEIDVDRDTGLPLRISGRAPRIGDTVLRLMVASPALPGDGAEQVVAGRTDGR